MTKNTTKAISMAAIITAVLISVSAGMTEDADAACRDCGKPTDLRIWADYGTGGWFGLDHHTSPNLGVNVGAGEKKSNSVTASQNESGYIYPSFMVKSNSVTSKTASYTISFTMVDPKLGTISTGEKRFNNVVFTSYLHGDSENFPALLNGIKKGTIHTVTLEVHSIS